MELYLHNQSIQRNTLIFLRQLYKGDNNKVAKENIKEIYEIFKKHYILELLLLNNEKYDNMAYSAAKVKCCRNKNYFDFIYEESENLFPQIEIPYAVLKGIVLAHLSYPNIGLRAGSDIDILIERKNTKYMNDLLKENGFQQGYITTDGVFVPYTREQQIFYMTDTHQMAPFFRKTKNKCFPYICIDINYSLFWGEMHNCINMEMLFKECKTMKYNSSLFQTLSLEANLFQACLHNYKENNSIFLLSKGSSINIRKYCDIYGLLIHPSLDVEKFKRLVESFSAQEYIYYSIYYTCHIFDTMEKLDTFHEWNNEKILNRFGLCEEEYEYWNNTFDDRLFCFNVEDLMNSLNEKSIKKIMHNRKYIKGGE